jgi:hypothetical protein
MDPRGNYRILAGQLRNETALAPSVKRKCRCFIVPNRLRGSFFHISYLNQK